MSKRALAIFAMLASSAASAQTLYDSTSEQTQQSSHTQMAIECDGSPHGKCYKKLSNALGLINADYQGRYNKGRTRGTPEHARAEAIRKEEMNGMTREEILERGDVLFDELMKRARLR